MRQRKGEAAFACIAPLFIIRKPLRKTRVNPALFMKRKHLDLAQG